MEEAHVTCPYAAIANHEGGGRHESDAATDDVIF